MTAGKSFFMADYGPTAHREKHLDAAFASIPEDEHQWTFDTMPDNPMKTVYGAAWQSIRQCHPSILDKASEHPNHLIRAMALRAAATDTENKWASQKKIAQKLIDDPHPYVSGQVVKYASDCIPSEQLERVAQKHPHPEVRFKASNVLTSRAMFSR